MAALILALVWITASHLLLVWLLIRATNRPRKRLDEDEEMPLKDLATVQTDTATVQTDTDAMVDSVQTEKENGRKCPWPKKLFLKFFPVLLQEKDQSL